MRPCSITTSYEPMRVGVAGGGAGGAAAASARSASRDRRTGAVARGKTGAATVERRLPPRKRSPPRDAHRARRPSGRAVPPNGGLTTPAVEARAEDLRRRELPLRE